MAAGLIPVAHIQAQLHKISGTTQGQVPQTGSDKWELSGSSGHQGQLWSSAESPSVAHRSTVIAQFDRSVVAGDESGQNLVQAGLGTFQK